MKKIFMVLMAAAMMSLVACGGKKGESNEGKADDSAAKTEAVATSSAVDKYIKLSDEALSLAKKAQAGDLSVSDRAVKIAQELADLSEELQKEVASSPEAAKKLQDYTQKIADAASGL
jgi:hypothetical protein